MKKTIIALLCLLIILPLVGCTTTSDNAVLTSLNNQLDRVENVVGATSTTEVNSVSPYTIVTQDSNQLSFYKAEAYYNMTKEEEMRQEVLKLNSKLKNSENKYYLGRRKASAVDSLTSNVSKYLNYLNNTKPEVKNNVNKITRATKSNTYNIENAKCSYIALSNTMSERMAYLNSLYNSLAQIDNILENSIVKTENKTDVNKNETTNSSNKTTTYSNNQTQTNANKQNCEECEENNVCGDCKNEQNTANGSRFNWLKPNIDTYYNPNLNNKSQNKEENNIANSNYTRNETETNQNSPSPQVVNPPYQTYPATGYIPPVNTGYGVVGNNGYGVNNTYGYNAYYNNFNFNRFNPSRNTDTFYPYMRNIDTYRLPPNFNGQYGYGYNQGVTSSQLIATKGEEEILDNDSNNETLADSNTQNTLEEKQGLNIEDNKVHKNNKEVLVDKINESQEKLDEKLETRNIASNKLKEIELRSKNAKPRDFDKAKSLEKERDIERKIMPFEDNLTKDFHDNEEYNNKLEKENNSFAKPLLLINNKAEDNKDSDRQVI